MDNTKTYAELAAEVQDLGYLPEGATGAENESTFLLYRLGDHRETFVSYFRGDFEAALERASALAGDEPSTVHILLKDANEVRLQVYRGRL